MIFQPSQLHGFSYGIEMMPNIVGCKRGRKAGLFYHGMNGDKGSTLQNVENRCGRVADYSKISATKENKTQGFQLFGFQIHISPSAPFL